MHAKLRPEWFKLSVVLAGGSLTTMSGGVIAPVLPDVMAQLEIDVALGGVLGSFHCLTLALFSPLLGLLADRFGPSRVLIPSLLFYGVFGVAGAWMTGFWSLLATRGLLGVACGGLAASCLGVLGRMYEGEARTRILGVATAVLTLTGIVYPLLGGVAGNENWRYAFYLNGIAFPLTIWAIYVFGGKVLSPKPQASRPLGGQLFDLLLRPRTMRLLLTMGLSSIAMYAVVIYAPIYLDRVLGLSPSLNGLVLAARALGAAAISAFGAKPLAKLIGLDRSTALGFGLMAVTLASIPWIDDFWGTIVAATIFGVGFGLVLPNLYNALANVSPFELKSSVLAVGTGVSFLGQFASPIILGVVLDRSSLEIVFYTAAVLTVSASFLLFAPVGIRS
ncbi:MFS transporter [Leptolyngbya valderiana BDU 20041]|nr:MFS transporter [Geitlerinema sp. CS-897]OAB60720.1 MFS transporter [Leptolyngbya valderiana BDU 20041]PPT08060.1 Major facilitator superfamily [Geitlerinema sp. FC II]